MSTNFFDLWFDLTWNRTRVYRFNSICSINSTTDRFRKLNDKMPETYKAKQGFSLNRETYR